MTIDAPGPVGRRRVGRQARLPIRRATTANGQRCAESPRPKARRIGSCDLRRFSLRSRSRHAQWLCPELWLKIRLLSGCVYSSVNLTFVSRYFRETSAGGRSSRSSGRTRAPVPHLQSHDFRLKRPVARPRCKSVGFPCRGCNALWVVLVRPVG